MRANPTNLEWIRLLSAVIDGGNRTSPRGFPCLELLTHQTMVSMRQPVVTVKERKIGYRFMVAEAWWILSGRNDLAAIEKYAPKMGRFSDDGFGLDGAYGPKVVDQLRYCCDSLIGDNNTRQAVLNIWRERPQFSRDVPCTLSIQFLIREAGCKRYLTLVDTMRSSDVWLGIPYDWFSFSMLGAYVLLMIREREKAMMDVELGNLVVTAGSQHLYESNLPAATEIINRRQEGNLQVKPLDLSEFSGPRDFLHHLEMLKDGHHTEHSWMTDVVHAAKLASEEESSTK